MRVHLESLESAIDKIFSLANKGSGSYVCVSNVHMCMEVQDSLRMKKVVNSSDLTVTDGKPIYLIAKLKNFFSIKLDRIVTQVRGQDLVDGICKRASDFEIGLSLGFYGGISAEVLDLVERNLKLKYPNINISFKYSPPFIMQGQEEDVEVINNINASKVDILFVGLGCPKQEEWMYIHKHQLSCCMIGVGAAFDFISGNKKHAPVLLQKLCLEWLYRLVSEPKRLWKRYLILNPRFLYLNLIQVFKFKS